MTDLTRRTVIGAALATPVLGVVTAGLAAPAYAAGYTWSRTLRQGNSGEDVRQLQIRVAGRTNSTTRLAIDGSFGPATHSAVRNFQSAYGLGVDGVAGPQTFGRIYDMQSSDNSPRNFTFSEMTGSGQWSGGNTSAATARANALIVMWQLQALRDAMGNNPLVVTSGFRTISGNAAVGGSTNSRHTYGDAADLVSPAYSFCQIARAARSRGFSCILGPGFPGHDDHIHVDRGSTTISAPNCSGF
ncbi:D-Ala-D-Ala carboxypeptidase family metallohydrolase [Bogoriella caseilytica]|uniref:Zinc D-Ala-D-Ala carboxypeptidase n=1 Tax=Bogoriella caseilytica TaxID=56055 RepID=A0A3N2BG65_9MICO|nr:D-Ala-D-Ala carboxypeptidase family metallohydrolase [Bogoriella caseilytica]ROR74208.1 zinc D-Ala-D-Ala carboxypeptidase [Bogoriella caseilytica]